MAPSVRPIGNATSWTIEAYLGKPLAVFAIMVMSIDDGQSDITSFSILFAGSDKIPKTIGPFKVGCATYV